MPPLHLEAKVNDEPLLNPIDNSTATGLRATLMRWPYVERGTQIAIALVSLAFLTACFLRVFRGPSSELLLWIPKT